MTRKELYSICHDEAVAYANSEQWSKRTGEEKSFLIQGYFDAMMEARKSEITEKKEYPKTYEECCQYLGCDDKIPLKIIGEFTKLINARNAYWKIAGEELGLGKPWKPDWKSLDPQYIILYQYGSTDKAETHGEGNYILAFPTEEMRDAFYENFKKEIEQCKELL